MTSTVTAVADAYVSASNPSATYGQASSLWIDGSPVMRTYLRFPSQSVSGLKATLQIYATRSTQSFEVRAVSDGTWKEAALTYAAAPGTSTAAVPSPAVTANSWVSVDVTSLLPAAGSEVNLAVVPISATSQAFASREAGSVTAPRLVLEQSSSGTDTTPPSVSITSPASGSKVTSAGTVSVGAAVSDNVGVTKVEFYDNGVYRGCEDSTPYAYSWAVDSSANGAHAWTAKAFDAAGNSTISAAVPITVAVTGGGQVTTKGTAKPAVETAAVPHSGDAADDPAIWANPTDPTKSLIIGTDKLGGLAVYDMTGAQRAYYADSKPNNVDLRTNVRLGGKDVTLVVTSDRNTNALRTYTLEPATGSLKSADARTLSVGIGLYGLCLFRSPTTAKLYAIDSDSSGTTQQWELYDNGAGKVDAKKVRTISVGSTVEGCVADDETGALFLAEEDVAIWRYDAEPTGGTTRTAVDRVGSGRLTADIEGLGLYVLPSGKGYLVASSQGSNSFAAYARTAPYAPLGTFVVGAGTGVDAVSYTDGLDIISASVGAGFETGAFVAQDDSNDGGNQNFKIVPWASVAAAFSPALLSASGTPASAASSSPVAAAAVATTYYVDSVAGSDAAAGTSTSTAWKTLAKVKATTLAAGSSVLLKRGSTWKESLAPKGNGSASAPITLGAYGTGNAPVITGSSSCVVLAGTYVTVRDLDVHGCSWAGVEISGSHNTLEASSVSDTAAGVYLKSGATYNAVLRNKLVNNNRMSVLTASPSSDDAGAFGILLHGDYNDIGYNTISGSDAFSYDYGRDGAAVEVYGGKQNTIHHNVATDNDAFTELGNSRSADNVYAYNLVRSSLATSTFLVTRGSKSGYGPVYRTKVYNNTVVLTGASSQGFICHAGCSSSILTMRNNIISAVVKAGYADAKFDENNDVFFGGKAQFTLGSASVVKDPAFVDPAAGNFRLRSTSPALDRGAALGYTGDLDASPVPVDGNGDGTKAPDAGAFEFH